MTFEKTFNVSWGQCDANGHMANTAALDLAADVRFLYFSSQGFSPAEFARLRMGPVVRRDEVDYHRELKLLEEVRVTFQLAGISEDASRFRLRNELYRADGVLAARVTTLGGWFDLAARKLIAPPVQLAAALRSLDRTNDFEVLESSVRKD